MRTTVDKSIKVLNFRAFPQAKLGFSNLPESTCSFWYSKLPKIVRFFFWWDLIKSHFWRKMIGPLDEKYPWILDFKGRFHENESTLYPLPQNSLPHVFSLGKINPNSSKSTKIMGFEIGRFFWPPPFPGLIASEGLFWLNPETKTRQKWPWGGSARLREDIAVVGGKRKYRDFCTWCLINWKKGGKLFCGRE